MIDDWKEGLSRCDLVNALNEVFYRDLESWFDASTFYCDSCVEDFIKRWPGIYNRDMVFQTNSIPLDSFYEGSRRVRELFTKDEFIDLFSDNRCPNCNDITSGNIWPYDMRFDVPPNFENDMSEIATLVEQTPFLLLSHPFALQVYNEIKTISNTTVATRLSIPLYRARRYINNKIYTTDDFFAPEKKEIVEGRYNHAGNQVLYLAEDEKTCFFEMRAPKEGIMLAEFEISARVKILDLMDENLEDNNIIQAIRCSSLLSSPDEGDGWNKPQYVFTRFVADATRAAGFEAIRYPSVRRSFEGHNLVFLDYEKIKQCAKIIEFNYFPEDHVLALSRNND